MHLAATILIPDWLFPECLQEQMGSERFWLGFVIFFCVLGVGAYFSNKKDIDNEREALERWDRRNKGESDFYEIYKQYSQSIWKQDSNGLAKELASRPEGTLHLLEERLLTIISLVRESNNVRIMPDVSEMHDLSLQSIESKWATKLLNVSVNCVLVCGICGTLWGVHHGLLNAGAGQILTTLGQCLLPSMFAVGGNILLVYLRNKNTVRLDRLLEDLDERTITQFIPALQPESNLGQTLRTFADAIGNTTEDSRMKFIADAPKKLVALVKAVMRSAQILGSALLGSAKRLNLISDAMEGMWGILARQQQDAQDLEKLSTTLQEKTESLATGIRQVQKTLAQFRTVVEDAKLPTATYRIHEDKIREVEPTLAKIQLITERILQWNRGYDTMLATSQAHIDSYTKKTGQVTNLISEITPVYNQLGAISASLANLCATDGPLNRALEIENTIISVQKTANEAASSLMRKMEPIYGLHTQNLASAQDIFDRHSASLSTPAQSIRVAYADFIQKSAGITGKKHPLLPLLVRLFILLAILIAIYLFLNS